MNIWKKAWGTTVGRRGLSVLMAGVFVAAVSVPTLGLSADSESVKAQAMSAAGGADMESAAAEEITPEETTTDEGVSRETAAATAAESAAAPAASISTGTSTNTSSSVTPTETEHITNTDTDDDEETGIVQMFPEELQYYGDNSTIALTDEQITEILEGLPSDLSTERIGVVLNAYSLEGKISYFWGGKSVINGWDVRWGNPAYVISAGSKSTGTLRTYGLDCSGYVNWVFNNTVGYNTADLVGDGTTGQWNLSTETAWEDAQPGDLALFYDPDIAGSANHVGIVVGWDENGELLVAHCSSGSGVIVSNAADYGFQYIRTPSVYDNEDYMSAAYSYKNLGNLLTWNASEALDEGNAVLGDLAYTEAITWSEGGIGVGVVIGRDQNGELLVAYGDGESTVVTTAGAAGFTQFRRAQNMKGVSVNAGAAGNVVMETGE